MPYSKGGGSVNTVYAPNRTRTDVTGDTSPFGGIGTPGGFNPLGIDAGKLYEAMLEAANLKLAMGREALGRAQQEDWARNAAHSHGSMGGQAPASAAPMSAERRFYMNKRDLDTQMNPLQNYTGMHSGQTGENFFNMPAAQSLTFGQPFANGFDVYAEMMRSAGGVRPGIGMTPQPWGQGA